MFIKRWRTRSVQNGYVYVPADDRGPMASAQPGARVSIPDRRPPYIVVDHSIASVLVARWPGRLWQVNIVEAVTAADERAAKLVAPVASAGYTRAVAVNVIQETPCATLFGEYGEAACGVLARAEQLDTELARTLAAARHPRAADAYSRAWTTWLTKVDPATPAAGNLTGALSVHTAGQRLPRSPLNMGFSVLDRAVRDRAVAVEGRSALLIDAEGELYLAPPWDTASNALLEAAMAFAAPDIAPAEDRRIMSTAWRAAFGAAPRGAPR